VGIDWLFGRKRHQRSHLVWGFTLLAKQVLSQLSYTPTVVVILILKHFPISCLPLIVFFDLDGAARTVQDDARIALPHRIAGGSNH
jgi:hypothetical protein